MKNTTRYAALAVISLGLASCGKTETSTNPNHDDHDGHDNAKVETKDEHAGHDHAADGSEMDDDGHDHAATELGPNGGRLLKSVEPHVEIFVTPERKVWMTVIDDDTHKAKAPSEELFVMITGDRSAPTSLTFTSDGEKWMSVKPLPEGNNLDTVIQMTMTPDGKKVTERMVMNLNQCPECDKPEYACTCDHDH